MADIPLAQLTEEALNGNGIFDVMMRNVSLHLKEEWNNNRLKGSDYSKVYSGALDVTMQQAIAFILGKQQADKQAELLAAQTALAVEQTIGVTKDNLIKDKQLEKLDEEIALLVQQIVNAKEAETLAQKQQVKIDAETALINQKTKSEIAQILDLVDGAAVTGVIGKQKELYAKQRDGFERDAEQKLAKLMTDTWNVRTSSDPDGTQANLAGLGDENIQVIIRKALEGVNAPVVPITNADAPIIIRNYLACETTQVNTINLNDLRATDADTDDATIIYTVESVSLGSLTIGGFAFAVGSNDTFTQQQIIDEDVVYTAPGTAGVANIIFSAKDTDDNTTANRIFEIAVSAP